MTRRWDVPAVVTVLALGGCGGGGDASPAAPPVSRAPATAAPTTAAPTTSPSSVFRTVPPAPRRIGEFVKVVRARVPEVARGRSDAEIATVAVQACQSLAAGRSADRIVAEAQSLGTLDAEATDQGTARELVKLAIDTVCLDQAGRVDEF